MLPFEFTNSMIFESDKRSIRELIMRSNLSGDGMGANVLPTLVAKMSLFSNVMLPERILNMLDKSDYSTFVEAVHSAATGVCRKLELHLN